VTEATDARARLGARLRELRGSWDGVRITQRHVAEALGPSPALVSSWESGVAVPPENRLQEYAWFFATPRTMNGRRAQLVSPEDDFWLLVSVPILAGERTVTPDLAQARLRLQTSGTRRG
jgi:hypothetical protein